MTQRLVAPMGIEETEPALEKWARRAITIPALFILFALDAVLLPLLVVGALVADVVMRRPFVATRFQLALAVALAVHVLGMVVLAGAALVEGSRRDLDARIEVWLARLVWRAAMRLYGMQIVVDGADALGGGALVVMPRHVSLLDPLLPPYLFSLLRAPHALRFVIKRELLVDPCIDVLGHRLRNAFVRRGGRDSAHEVAHVQSLAMDLGPSDAVVIFPEGTRFTPEKRERLAVTDPRASAYRHVMPPHPGGALAVLAAAPNADVVFCAHTGLEGANHFRDLARGSLIGAKIRVRLWRAPAQSIPRAPDERFAWLETWWRTLDDWLGEAS